MLRLCALVLASLWLWAATAHAEDAVILYSKPNFTGDQLYVRGDVANLRTYDFNDETSSMIVLGGEWGIYPDKNYGGTGIRVPPGNYANMEAVLFKNNELSSIKLVKPTAATPPPPPPKAKLPDLQRKVDARSGYQGTVTGEGDARTASGVTYRGITVYVTVTNAGEADAEATTVKIEPGDSMADFRKYVSAGQQPCPDRQVPWPDRAGKPIVCTALKSGDIAASASGPVLTCNIPALAINQSARCAGTLSVLYNWAVPDFGDWQITAIVDPDGKLKESSKKNNGNGAETKVTKDELPPLAE